MNVYDPAVIRRILKRVFRYTVAHAGDSLSAENWDDSQNAFWERGVFYTGVMGAYGATGDEEYLKQAIRWSNSNGWELAKNRMGYTFGDNQTCGQTYLDLYLLQGGDEKIAHVRQVIDELASDPPTGRDLWWWCDSLYMAPPVLVRLARATGNSSYNKLMNRLWWDSKAYLYDEEEGLFYRDKNYFPSIARTRNGKKVFWSRGNGWVLGGLARMLQVLPEDDPHRSDFVSLFRAMAEVIAGLQGDDGLWRTSLLDFDEWPLPETSGTALFCFAMTWGVNAGLLDRQRFTPVIRKAWEGLNGLVDKDGRLGWVQFVAAAPGPVSPGTMREYAPGAFLLSGAEMLRLLGGEHLRNDPGADIL